MVTSDSQFWVSMAKNKLYMLSEIWKSFLEGRTLKIHQKDNEFLFAVYPIKENCFPCIYRVISIEVQIFSTLDWNAVKTSLRLTKVDSGRPLGPAVSLSPTAFSSQFSLLTQKGIFSFSPWSFSPAPFYVPSKCGTVSRKTRLWRCSATSPPSFDTDTPEAFSISPADLLSFPFIKHMQKKASWQENRSTTILSKAIKLTSASQQFPLPPKKKKKGIESKRLKPAFDSAHLSGKKNNPAWWPCTMLSLHCYLSAQPSFYFCWPGSTKPRTQRTWVSTLSVVQKNVKTFPRSYRQKPGT